MQTKSIGVFKMPAKRIIAINNLRMKKCLIFFLKTREKTYKVL